MSRATVLVTGGAGYIGSHACKALANSGYLPVAFDDLSTGHRSAVRWGPLEVGDLASAATISEVMARHAPVAVLHFAASAYVGESVHHPARYYRNNVSNTLNLLDTMREHCVDQLVFSSTCATYGLPERLPIDETHPQRPINPYGHSKLFVEGVLAAYERAYGLRWTALRYFNAAGADPDGEIGEDHDPETHLIPLALLSALGRRPALEVFGTDYATSDGSAVRDYVHVSDLAHAHVLALQRLLAGESSLALNLGVGNGHSVRAVVAAVARVTGAPVPLVERPRREGDPPTLIADATRAQGVLGWHPQRSELDELVGSAWEWLRRSNDAPQPFTATQGAVGARVRPAPETGP